MRTQKSGILLKVLLFLLLCGNGIVAHGAQMDKGTAVVGGVEYSYWRETNSGKPYRAEAQRYVGESGTCVIPATIEVKGITYDVWTVDMADSPKLRSVSLEVGSAGVTFTGCGALSRIDYLGTSANRHVTLNDVDLESLTVGGNGARIVLSSGTIESLVFEGAYAAAERAGGAVVSVVTVGSGVEEIGTFNGLSAEIEFEKNPEDMECLHDFQLDGVFASCHISEFAVWEEGSISSTLLRGTNIGRLDISRNIGYELNMNSVETLFVGDDVLSYIPPSDNTCVPENYEGASLKTVGVKTSLTVTPSLVYDFDGDGVMSLVASAGRSIWDWRTVEVEQSFDEPTGDSNVQTKYKLNRIVNLDNTGNGAVIIDPSRVLVSKGSGNFEWSRLPESYLFFDANADGLTDLYDYSPGGDRTHTVYYRQPDGSYLKSALKLTTRKEDVYNEIIETNENWITGLPSLEDGWMIGGYVDQKFDNIGDAADLTKDGIPDLLDTNVGGILYNIGENTYYASQERGLIYQCDLNGDGVLDYVLFDKTEGSVYLMLYGEDGAYSQKLLMENMNISSVYCKDFDGDGDIDILLPFDYTDSAGYSFLVFYRNDGGGTFKKKETSYPEQLSFKKCLDVDADGRYEVIAQNRDRDSRKYELWELECKDDFTVEKSVLSDRDPEETLLIGDLDNDGTTEMLYNYAGKYLMRYPFGGKNTAPKQMAAPTVYLDSETGKIRIMWAEGSDSETSACDLTYELRIGTAPGKADVLGTTSLADGRRRSPDEGNMGRSLYHLFNPAALSEGTLYIAVQAIDGGGLGSAWSEEAAFDYKPLKPQFRMNFVEMTTADTLELVAVERQGVAYEWSVSGGKIIEAEGNKAKAVFDRYGTYEIGLTLSDGETRLTSDPQKLTVLMFKEGEPDYSADIESYSGLYADFDGDGDPDFLTTNDSYNVRGLYANDGNGEFTKVGKTFNSDLSGAEIGIIDYNKDGYPDFLINASKGTVFINSGEGDLDFEYEKKEFTIIDGDYDNYPDGRFWADFNNDGYPECFSQPSSSNNKVFLNGGDNLTYTVAFHLGEGDAGWTYFWSFADVNRNGFVDIILEPKKSWDDSGELTKETVCVMLKDSTASHLYSDPIPLFEREYVPVTELAEEFLADLNSDGYLDLVYRKQGENKLYVVKGASQSEWPCREVVEIPLVGDYEFTVREDPVLRDYDNNGYPDIRLEVEEEGAPGNAPTEGILLMQPDFKAELCRIDGADILPFLPLADGRYPQMGSYLTFGQTDNEAPEKPGSVMAKQTKEGMLITWDDAADDHTPAMQMQYNVSVKKKGATGEGSFLISPMNALNDKATVVSNYIYKKSDSMIVPIGALEAGQTYEVQVQAIDLWNAHSPMTAPVEITVSADGYIDMADRVATGKETTLKYVGTAASSFSCELDGGELVSDNGKGEFTAKWATPGVKHISVTAGSVTVKSAVTVSDPLDVDFELPSGILAGAPVVVNVPEAISAATGDAGFRSESDNLQIDYKKGDTTAVFLFKETGSYEVEAYADDALLGNECRRTAVVSEAMPLAEITKVDAEEGRYAISWPVAGMPQSVDRVIVSKETNRLNQFAVLDTVALSDGRYVDLSSRPDVVAARYTVSLLASNGQTSYASDAHKPLHVMVNDVAGGNGYNLMWSAYEGREVDYYTILRGSSSDNLVKIAEVAGSMQNYTDRTAPEGECFYAVSFTPAASGQLRTAAAADVRSNVVSSADVIPTVYAKSLNIRCLEDEMILNGSQKALHLFAELLPLNATFNRVVWTVVSGNELAAIDQNGVLSAVGDGEGSVVVRAVAIDGSGLTAEVTVACEKEQSGIGEIPEAEGEDGWCLKLVYRRGAQGIALTGWPESGQVTLYVVSMEGRLVDLIRTSDAAVEIDCSRYADGVYAVKAVAGGESETAKFICD